MPDSRIENLTDEILIAELEALKASLKLVLDDPSYSAGDAKKMLISLLFNSSIVSAATNDFQALTPKGFYNSIMTTARKGIGKLATSTQIEDKMGNEDAVLYAGAQGTMQTQWWDDWFIKNGVPAKYASDVYPTPRCIAFDAFLNQTMGANDNVSIGPVLAAGYRYQGISFTFAGSIAANVGKGFVTLGYTGSTENIVIALGLSFQLSADGREISIKCGAGSAGGLVLVSTHINAIIFTI